MKQSTTHSTAPADFQAQFWTGPATRAEVQSALNEQAGVLAGLQSGLTMASLGITFLFSRLGVPKDEFEAFLKDYAAQVNSAAPPTPAPQTPAVTEG